MGNNGNNKERVMENTKDTTAQAKHPNHFGMREAVQTIGLIMRDAAKLLVAIIGLVAALAVAQIGVGMAAEISGFQAEHPSMVVSTIAAHLACLYGWFVGVRDAWKRFNTTWKIDLVQ